jgi:hypothetical protein
MPVFERIMALWYPVPIHEQRLTCFKNLTKIQESVGTLEKQTNGPVAADSLMKLNANYKAEYERCEPIMKMQ